VEELWHVSGFSFLSVVMKCEKLHYAFSKASDNVTDSLVCFRGLLPSTKPSVITVSFPNIISSNRISLNVDSVLSDQARPAYKKPGLILMFANAGL